MLFAETQHMSRGLIVVAVAAIAGCSLIGIQGSGVKKTETRKVGSFTRIRVEGSSDVNVKRGPLKVAVTADDNLLQSIVTKIEGDTLVIESRKSISPKVGIVVDINMPKLEGVAVEGSGDIRADDVRAAAFHASIAGSGDVWAAGSADSIDASIAGSGDIDFRKLPCKNAKASISGSGNIDLAVSGSLSASIAGSGAVTYSGKPRVTKSIAGSGDVRRR